MSDVVASVTCLAVVLGTLVTIDDRVQQRFWNLSGEISGGNISAWTDRLNLFVASIADAARYQSIENAPLLIFAMMGTLLTAMMLRLRA